MAGSPSGRSPASTRWSRTRWYAAACRQGDYALVGVAALVTLNAAGRCDRVRLTLCGVGPTALRAREAEQILLGELPVGDALAAAAERAAAATDPPSDVHASAQFR